MYISPNFLFRLKSLINNHLQSRSQQSSEEDGSANLQLTRRARALSRVTSSSGGRSARGSGTTATRAATNASARGAAGAVTAATGRLGDAGVRAVMETCGRGADGAGAGRGRAHRARGRGGRDIGV
jgi:hypothetical protein